MTDETGSVPAGVVAVPISNGQVMLVDEGDVAALAPYRWRASWEASSQTFYARGWDSGRRRHLLAHRVVLDAPKGVKVDHANHDGLDNRRSNLRLCNGSTSAANRRLRHDSKSGYKGVWWESRTQSYRAYIGRDGGLRHLGRFKDPWEAAQAYNAAAVEQWGAFAFLNERHGESGPESRERKESPPRRSGRKVFVPVDNPQSVAAELRRHMAPEALAELAVLLTPEGA